MKLMDLISYLLIAASMVVIAVAAAIMKPTQAGLWQEFAPGGGLLLVLLIAVAVGPRLRMTYVYRGILFATVLATCLVALFGYGVALDERHDPFVGLLLTGALFLMGGLVVLGLVLAFAAGTIHRWVLSRRAAAGER